ncbi:hypothetical protein CR513_14318, partial [Mucuna pruriens]
MKEEIKELEKNSTWEIVDRLKDKRAVDCRWIYTVKWYTQTYGIDYEETFAPITNMNTIRSPTLVGTCNSLMLKMSSFMET